MELIFLAVILVRFLLPSILIGRKQRQRQRQVVEFQQSLVPGQRVVTAGGIVGTVVSTNNNAVELEVAPNVIMTFERMGILRSADALENAGGAGGAAVENQQPAGESIPNSQSFDDRGTHPENYPQNPESGHSDDGDYGTFPESKN